MFQCEGAFRFAYQKDLTQTRLRMSLLILYSLASAVGSGRMAETGHTSHLRSSRSPQRILIQRERQIPNIK